MKKYYYVHKDEAEQIVRQITAEQARAGFFCNVEVKPYKGKKYSAGDTVVIVVG